MTDPIILDTFYRARLKDYFDSGYRSGKQGPVAGLSVKAAARMLGELEGRGLWVRDSRWRSRG